MKRVTAVVESSGLSHVGPVREDNQDSIHLSNGLCDPETARLFVVADGMGGYSHGAIASSLAIEKLADVLRESGPKVSARHCHRGVEHANVSVYKKAQQLGAGRMGTTLTAAVIAGEELHLIHIGDSRAYLVRQGRSICLTADHTAVGDLVRAKLLPPEKVRSHAQRSILTRAVGIGLFIRPDISKVRLEKNDHLILCSDGVWSVVQDCEFAEAVDKSLGIDQVSRSLVDLALRRETDDNVSVVAIHILELKQTGTGSQERIRLGWFSSRKNKAL